MSHHALRQLLALHWLPATSPLLSPPLLDWLLDTESMTLRFDQHCQQVPVELITTSASGLDNNLTPQAAAWQIPRVAQARGLSKEAVATLIAQHTTSPLVAFIGQPVVNIVELNLALDALKDK